MKMVVVVKYVWVERELKLVWIYGLGFLVLYEKVDIKGFEDKKKYFFIGVFLDWGLCGVIYFFIVK